jgi:transposase
MRNSMKQQRRFTKEFEEEAVRLVQTSGRTQREIAGDLGIGLSTLVRWIGRSRDRRAADPATAVANDVTAELKRLRRENEILRQERDILKKPPLFSPGREVDEVRAHRWGKSGIPRPSPVPRAWC